MKRMTVDCTSISLEYGTFRSAASEADRVDHLHPKRDERWNESGHGADNHGRDEPHDRCPDREWRHILQVGEDRLHDPAGSKHRDDDRDSNDSCDRRCDKTLEQNRKKYAPRRRPECTAHSDFSDPLTHGNELNIDEAQRTERQNEPGNAARDQLKGAHRVERSRVGGPEAPWF